MIRFGSTLNLPTQVFQNQPSIYGFSMRRLASPNLNVEEAISMCTKHKEKLHHQTYALIYMTH